MSWVFARISSAFFLVLRNSLIHFCIRLQSRSEGPLACSRANVPMGRAPSFCSQALTVQSFKGTNTCFSPLAVTLIMPALYIGVWLYFYLTKCASLLKKLKGIDVYWLRRLLGLRAQPTLALIYFHNYFQEANGL